MTPRSFTTPLRIDSLPKDFEPKLQKQEFYLSPEEGTEAGIEPPTPVLRALRVGRVEEGKGESEMGKGKEREHESKDEAIAASSGEGRGGYTTKDDGRVEREV